MRHLVITAGLTAAMLVAGCRRSSAPTEKADELAIPPAITDVTLPASRAPAHATSSFRVYVGRKELAVGTPPHVVATLPADVGARSKGFDAALKRSGQNDLFVTPLHAAVPKGQDTALVYVDRDTPYRVLVEVMFTLGQAEVGHFHFVTKDGTSPLSTFEVTPPSACGGRMLTLLQPRGGGALEGVLKGGGSAEPPAPAPAPPLPSAKPCKEGERTPHLNVTVVVVDGGFSVKAVGNNVAPGCKDTGPGIAVPTAGGAYDYAALTACLARLQATTPDFADERDIIVSASPAITAQTVFATVAAVRTNADGGVLFPEPAFGIPN